MQCSYDGQDNLIGVTYPDGTSNTYHYEDPDFPHHLTGITDENNQRFSTWTYTADGKAASSEHADGVEKVTLEYSADRTTTTVTGALGDTRTYNLKLQHGARKVTSVSGDPCTTCGNGQMQSRTYDESGFLDGYTDWNGNQARLTRNDRGLVETRTEALGTPEERTTTTEWHSTFCPPA